MKVQVGCLEASYPEVREYLREVPPRDVRETFDVCGMTESVWANEMGRPLGPADRSVVRLTAASGVEDDGTPEKFPRRVHDAEHGRVEAAKAAPALATELVLVEVGRELLAQLKPSPLCGKADASSTR